MSSGERRANAAKVSVIMPAFNRGETIETSVRSVLEQSYDNFEIIVVDDGSTDATAAIVLKLSAGMDESRIRLIRLEENMGVSAARNAGLRHASGELIAYLDSDNTWRKNFLMVNGGQSCHVTCR